MTYNRLDQSSWEIIHEESSPIGIFKHLIFADLLFPSDRALITVSTTINDADWVRAGWVGQVWERTNDDPYLITKSRIDLNTSLVLTIEPLAQSVITFEPVEWLYNYSIKIEARPFLDT